MQYLIINWNLEACEYLFTYACCMTFYFPEARWFFQDCYLSAIVYNILFKFSKKYIWYCVLYHYIFTLLQHNSFDYKKCLYIFYMRFIVAPPTFKTLRVDSCRIQLVKRNISAVGLQLTWIPWRCITAQTFGLKLSGNKQHTQNVRLIICPPYRVIYEFRSSSCRRQTKVLMYVEDISNVQ